MKYFFLLGNNSTLSIAEISAIFDLENNKSKRSYLINENIFILETKKEINAHSLIKKLGGTIKIGIIDEELKINDPNLIKKSTIKLIYKKDKTGKFKFGISIYGKSKIKTKNLGLEIKKELKAKNISCRYVVSKEKTLSSVVVEQNKLNTKGLELVLLPYQCGQQMSVAHTLAVQPFKELSKRDYGRPARDDHSGMLPPKLAQIMINLSSTNTSSLLAKGGVRGGYLLDPFCGSGTILTEAMLMDNISLLLAKGEARRGYIGSDISEKAIKDTRKNIEWIIKKFELKALNYKLHNISATELSKKIKPESIDMIVTEPYLGPQRGRLDLNKIIPELENLYSKTISEFKKLLKPKGKIVMLFPVFRIAHNEERVTPKLNGFKILNPIPKFLINNQNIKLTNRSTIIYGRTGQRVWREIVVLKKI